MNGFESQLLLQRILQHSTPVVFIASVRGEGEFPTNSREVKLHVREQTHEREHQQHVLFQDDVTTSGFMLTYDICTRT